MLHRTRKHARRTLACSLGFALAAALALPGGAAFAFVGGGSMGGEDAIDHVDKPFGQIVRIIPDRGMSALLFLPSLPVDPYQRDEETGHPALQVLYVDRAYADEPGEWERWGTFEWVEDWQEYAFDIDSIRPVYDDNYEDQAILYCTVSYSSPTVDYRDFYLRATAVTLEDGVLTTTAFEPALFKYEEEWLPSPSPDPDEPNPEPPNVVNPPEVDAGDNDGNRGGVGQGESERIDPEGTVRPLPSAPDVAYAIEGSEAGGGSGASNGNEAADGATDGKAADGAEGAEGAQATASASAAAAHDDVAHDDASADASSAQPTVAEEQVPGFLWAAGVTACAVVGLGLVIALARRARR
ncbi:hypothetical protein [Eggerthella sinensis]|uniref:hypothetical protein n=1 Tax=Eggerthella sinensis TaxID=242230 RepID=UPI001D076A40|nr:hypothetical protein [Eggerthella sinensis]MCB7037739.1 hypothetical protein [Eggerthella sinensis]